MEGKEEGKERGKRKEGGKERGKRKEGGKERGKRKEGGKGSWIMMKHTIAFTSLPLSGEQFPCTA